MKVAAAWLALVWLVSGCDPDRPASDRVSDGGEGSVELGKGETAFEPLMRGETLPIAAGTQGGHHVWVAFRIRGLDPARLLVSVTTSVEDHPELDLERSGRLNFTLDPAVDDDAGAGDEVYVYWGWPAQILDAPNHMGEHATIRALLTDRSGREARTAQTIVIGGLTR